MGNLLSVLMNFLSAYLKSKPLLLHERSAAKSLFLCDVTEENEIRYYWVFFQSQN